MADNETIADIIAEKRRLAEQIRNNLSTVLVRQWHQQAEIKSLEDEANRLEAAHKRERGDCAKLREALRKINSLCGIGVVEISSFEIGSICDAALSNPPRNCDKYANRNDAMQAFEAFVREQGKLGFINPYTEAFKWLLAPATEKEGGAK